MHRLKDQFWKFSSKMLSVLRALIHISALSHIYGVSRYFDNLKKAHKTLIWEKKKKVFLYIYMYVHLSVFVWKALYIYWLWSEIAQSCPTLCDPMDGSYQSPRSMGFSRQEHWSGLPFPSPGDRTRVSCTADRRFTIWAAREALTDYSLQKILDATS